MTVTDRAASQPIRWGILSGSNFAANHMAPAINEAEGAIFAALATSSPAKADRFRRFAPGIKVVDDYQAVLDDPQIDAVYIPLPNHMHIDWASRALRAGKHVLVEKPIAMEAAEIDPLIALRDQTGLVCAEAYMIVHHPQWQKTRELIRGGAVGEVKLVDAAFSFNLLDPNNIRNRADAGGGSLPDIGVYTLGSVRWVTGQEPISVAAQIDWEDGIDTTAHVQARFPGFAYQMTTSMRLCPRQEVIFHGTKGVLRVTAPFNAGTFGEATVTLQMADHTVQQFRYPDARQYKNQVEAFGRAIRGVAPFPWTLEDAKGTQSFIDRAYEAAGGRPG